MREKKNLCAGTVFGGRTIISKIRKKQQKKREDEGKERKEIEEPPSTGTCHQVNSMGCLLTYFI